MIWGLNFSHPRELTLTKCKSPKDFLVQISFSIHFSKGKDKEQGSKK